ncbi:type I-E CRISPR-associated endoribonuclease Cas2e [Solwaraspora sp. WMMD406]|uniref:type I-E CRISPR-associated endoribonuclease Cas2e n=1 Tax=Solwaraspora sp. WMMD406 TaxID=3016095 RepID=UPI002415C4A0|nr:type I-E CRISPR-associated endoribonuclease Cas2e [Solwaraspora sp. WMMD406]MDG4765928.1 type I-E CRISPR-associated endoribonuclease Cas2e [Solwaraspora sp. WMMD406]
MVVIVLTACPAGLRGHLTQWLLEISAGVYVGHVTARVRDRLWGRVVELAGPGRALMVYQVRGEQRLSFKVHDHHWQPVDFDGIMLMRRPADPAAVSVGPPPSGWSKASKRRRFGRRGSTPSSQPTGQEQNQSE